MTFKQYLQQRGMVTATISRHLREAARWEQWMEQTRGFDAQGAGKADLIAYLQHLKQSRHLSSPTQSHILRMIKNYHRYLEQVYDTGDITRLIKIRGAQRKKLRPLFTPDELHLLCDAYYCHTTEYTPTRKELRFYPDFDKLLQGRYLALTLMAYQGLHTGEVLRLTQNHFELRKATVTVEASRQGQGRTLALEAEQIGPLMQYFTALPPETALIPNANHLERLSSTLKQLTRSGAAGITRFADFKHLRASVIMHWIKLHGLRKAQHLAGHKNIRSTENYLATDTEALQNDMDNFHPLQ